MPWTRPTACRRRKAWRETFGYASKRYPRHYRPRPGGRRFVLHLDKWYAQSHPTEDFADFAVWLKPSWSLAARFAGWPALRKLQYVAATMEDFAAASRRCVPATTSRPIRIARRTLRRRLAAMQRHYRGDDAEKIDKILERVLTRRRTRTRRDACQRLPRAEHAAAAAARGAPARRERMVEELLEHLAGRTQLAQAAGSRGGSALRRVERLLVALTSKAQKDVALVGAMKKLRVLVLVHETLVPPESIDHLTDQEGDVFGTEFDVINTLKELGHEVRPLGIGDSLTELEAADHRLEAACSASTCWRNSVASLPTTSTSSPTSS